MTKFRYAVSVLSLLALTAGSVWAQGAAAAPPAAGTPTALAIAALTKAMDAVAKGDGPALEDYLNKQVMGILLDPKTGTPQTMVLQRDDIVKAIEQAGNEMDPLAGQKLVNLTGQPGPGDLILVTYDLAPPAAAGAVPPKPVGPFWALVGKIDGGWRIISFAIPMPAPEQ
jgi:hypothetical protein